MLAEELGYPGLDPRECHAFREAELRRHKNEENPYRCYCGELGKKIGCKLSAEEVHARRYQISRRMLREDVRLRQGAAATLKRIKNLGLRMAVATLKSIAVKIRISSTRFNSTKYSSTLCAQKTCATSSRIRSAISGRWNIWDCRERRSLPSRTRFPEWKRLRVLALSASASERKTRCRMQKRSELVQRFTLMTTPLFSLGWVRRCAFEAQILPDWRGLYWRPWVRHEAFQKP